MADATYTLRWIGPADCAGAVEQTLAAVGVHVRRKELRRARGESESRINLMVQNDYVAVDSVGLDVLFAQAVGVGLAASQMEILGRAGVGFDVDLYGGGPDVP